MSKNYKDIQDKVYSQLQAIIGNGYSLTPAFPRAEHGKKCEVYYLNVEFVLE